jgi:SWI/SNF-related matrix-associated actin-dependent regulator of chromatin subfamily A protein 2/4
MSIEKERNQKPHSKKQRKKSREKNMSDSQIANDSGQTTKLSRATEILMRQAQQNEFLIQYYSSSIAGNNNGAADPSHVPAVNMPMNATWPNSASASLSSQDRSNLMYDDSAVGSMAQNSYPFDPNENMNAVADMNNNSNLHGQSFQIKLFPPPEDGSGHEETLTHEDASLKAQQQQFMRGGMMNSARALPASSSHLQQLQASESMQVEEEREECAGNQFVNDIFLPKSPEKKKRKRRAVLSQSEGDLSRITNASGTNILIGLGTHQRSSLTSARGSNAYADPFSLNQASNNNLSSPSSWPIAKSDHQYYLPRQQQPYNHQKPPHLLGNNANMNLAVHYSPPLKSSLDDILSSNRSTLKSPFDDLLTPQRPNSLLDNAAPMNIFQNATTNTANGTKKNVPKISLLHKRAALNNNDGNNHSNGKSKNSKGSNKNAKNNNRNKNTPKNNQNQFNSNTNDAEANFDYLVVQNKGSENSMAKATTNSNNNNNNNNNSNNNNKNNNNNNGNNDMIANAPSQPMVELLTVSNDSWRRTSGEAWRRNSREGSPSLAASFEWKRTATEWKEESVSALFATDHLQWRSASQAQEMDDGSRALVIDGGSGLDAIGEDASWRKRGSDEWRRCSLQDSFQSGQDPFGMGWKRRRNDSGTWKRASLSDGATDNFFF